MGSGDAREIRRKKSVETMGEMNGMMKEGRGRRWEGKREGGERQGNKGRVGGMKGVRKMNQVFSVLKRTPQHEPRPEEY